MDDRILVTRLLDIGVTARQSNPESYAGPADDVNLRDIGVATIAHWLEELGRHRLIGSVQPCFTSSGAGFEFQVTDEAVRLISDASKFNAWLNTIVRLALSSMCLSVMRRGIRQSLMSYEMTSKGAALGVLWQRRIFRWQRNGRIQFEQL